MQSIRLSSRNSSLVVTTVLLALSCAITVVPAWSWDYAPNVNKLLDDAGTAYDRGQYTSARDLYKSALELEPQCPDAYNGLGLCAFKEGNIAESDRCYGEAIKKKSDHYNARYNLANNCYIQEKYDAAIENYLQVLKIGEKSGKGADADLYTSVANVFRDKASTLTGILKQDEQAHAHGYYNSALQKNPQHFKAHANLGRLYLDEGQFAAAEKEFRAAIGFKSDYSYAYYELGRLYSMRNEKPAALVAYYNSLKNETVNSQKEDTVRKIVALGIDPALYRSFAEGFEDLMEGRWDAAAASFDSAAASVNDPKGAVKKAVALNNSGYAHSRAGNMALAIDSYTKALKLCPKGQPQFYYNLGQAFLQGKRYDDARQAFETCISESQGNHFLAHNALGIVLKLKSETAKGLDATKLAKEALNEYNVALMQSSDALSVASFNRGLVLEKLGQPDEAKKSYRHYLESSPTGLNASAARQRLEKLK